MISTPEWNYDDLPERGVSRRELATAAGIFALAVILRLFRLGEWSFWADELATLRDAQDLGAVIGYPVGYALIGWTVRTLGTSEFTARLVPALAGAAAAPCVYVIGRGLFSHRTGALAALFLSLSTYHLFFSQFARYYTLLVVLALAAMWAVFTAFERNSAGRLLVGLVLLALAFWTHWSAALLVPAMAVYLLWSARGRQRPVGMNRRNVSMLLCPLALAGVLLLPGVLSFLRGWSSGVGFSARAAALTAAKLLYRMEAPLVACAAAGAWVLLRSHDRRAKWLLCFAAAPPVAAVVFVGFSQGGSRFGIISLPAVAILAGAALDWLVENVPRGRRKLVYVVVALVVSSMVMKDVVYFTREMGQRPRWREAGGQVVPSPGGVPGRIISTSPALVRYYAGVDCVDLRTLSAEALETFLSTETGGEGPTHVLVEHAANVAPTRAQQDVLHRRAVVVARWPLRVGPLGGLDYSITLYGNSPRGPSD